MESARFMHPSLSKSLLDGLDTALELAYSRDLLMRQHTWEVAETQQTSTEIAQEVQVEISVASLAQSSLHSSFGRT